MVADHGKRTFPRGIHPAAHKGLAANKAIVTLSAPKQVLVPLVQHIGAPGVPALKPRSQVEVGNLLIEAGGFVSARAHATIVGATAKPVAVTLANGRHLAAVPIKAKGDQLEPDAVFAATLGGDWACSPSDHEPAVITDLVRDAGIVGMGGAAFPTHVKLTRNDEKPVDTLLVNGCECEPYLTADYRLMLEATMAVISGARLAARACGASRVVIATEVTKPLAITALREAAGGFAEVEIASLAAKYPMGGEKQAVRAALGRTIPTGGLPLDVGVVVINVGTCVSIAGAVLRNRPMTHRVVTVSGAGVQEPGNLLVPIGTPVQTLIDHCGGLTEDAVRIISGGPMMGFALANLDGPVTKGTSGLTILTKADVAHADETTCVRCGKCVDVCPLNLVPTRLGLASRHQAWDLAKRYHLNACMECGCCAYTCPAQLPLVQLIRTGKARMARAGAA